MASNELPNEHLQQIESDREEARAAGITVAELHRWQDERERKIRAANARAEKTGNTPEEAVSNLTRAVLHGLPTLTPVAHLMPRDCPGVREGGA